MVGLVDHLDLGRLAIDQQFARRADRREVGVVGDVFPVVAEILGGEGRAIGPFMALAQMEGEDAPFLDVEALQDVGHQIVMRVVAHQPRIAIDHHVAGVLGRGHQHVQFLAVFAGHLALPLELGDGWIVRAGAGRWAADRPWPRHRRRTALPDRSASGVVCASAAPALNATSAGPAAPFMPPPAPCWRARNGHRPCRSGPASPSR